MWKVDDKADHEEFLIVTHWKSKEAHYHWTRSEAFRTAHSGPRADFTPGHTGFTGYEVRIVSYPLEEKVPI